MLQGFLYLGSYVRAENRTQAGKLNSPVFAADDFGLAKI